MGNFIDRLQNALDPRYREQHGLNPDMRQGVRVQPRDLDMLIHQFLKLDDTAREAYNAKRAKSSIGEHASVSERIHHLWHQLPIDTDRSTVVVMLDNQSRHDAAYATQTSTLLPSLTFEVVHPPIDDVSYVGDASVPEMLATPHPRLVAMRYTKPNGRTAYLDDPYNSQEFL